MKQKAVAMINGVEVKVGQIWKDGAGLLEEIKLIDKGAESTLIFTNTGVSYDSEGKHFSGDCLFDLDLLVKDVAVHDALNRSELHSLLEVNAYEIAFITGRIKMFKIHESAYYNWADKEVKETEPYFKALNSTRNKIKKYKAKLKKLIDLQCKLKVMYNKAQ